MSDAAKLAWMIIYLENAIYYLEQNHPIASEEAGFHDLLKQIKELEPIIQKCKDEKE